VSGELPVKEVNCLTYNIELLSPAGTWGALVAAVQNGADAIYLGGKAFNARQYAGNFDNEKLKQAVEYCHIRGVKIYLTVNTLLNDRELKELIDYIIYAYNIGIDAVIVQDLGVAKLIKEITPDFSLHASTQMTVHNLDGVKLLEKIGFDRVVLARELSCEEIKYICQNTSLEIEVFVHGALCISYSGQCLMSSLIGGRSGNRGRCAQPCRLPYEFIDRELKEVLFPKVFNRDENQKYLLSPKDLSLIKHLNALKNAGVKSFKIEGRMKRAEYVAVITKIYRHYLDTGLAIDPKDYHELLQIFNRGGFTQGYFEGKTGQNMMSYRKPNNWGVHIGEVVLYDKKRQMVQVKLKSNLHVGDGIEVWTKSGQGQGAVVTKLTAANHIVQSASKGEVVSFKIKGDINKGDKVYKTSDIKLNEQAKISFHENANNRTIPIYGNCKIELGKPISLNLWDDEGNFIAYVGERTAEQALHKELECKKVLEQLHKLGGTPFQLINMSIDLQPGLALPISEINNARRNAVELLEKRRIDIHLEKRTNIELKNIKHKISGLLKDDRMDQKTAEIKLSVQIHHYPQLKALTKNNVDRIYIPVNVFLKNDSKENLKNIIQDYISQEIEVFCVLPRILREKDFPIYMDAIQKLNDFGIAGIMIGNIGHMNLLKDNRHLKLFGDFGLNVFNSLSLYVVQQLGFKGVTLSPELTLKQIKDIKKQPLEIHAQSDKNVLESEIIVYGRLPLMVMENCPIGNLSEYLSAEHKCRCDQRNYGLLDRKGMVFPIQTNKYTCRAEILNSQPIFLADSMDDILASGTNAMRLLFTIESPEKCEKITNLYKDALVMGQEAAVKKHSDFVNQIEKEGFTRGHYYRGVE
jgi:putative protease